MKAPTSSRKHATPHALALALAAAFAPAAFAQAQAPRPATAASAAESGQLQTISVTAQRVKQKLQDVPAAVTAFSPVAIENLQINSVMDISRLVPNVKFDPVTAGTTSLKPFVRGGGVADGGQITSESEVGIYVDDVYRARLSAALIDFVELDRIEVLRGPQGVLYGRNSSAGAVNIITRAPTDTFTASAEIGLGNLGEKRLKGYVSAPLSADKRWRASLQGMVRQRDTNGQYNVTLKKDVGEEKFQGLQGDIAYEGRELQGRLTVFHTRTDGDGQWAVPNTITNGGKTITPSTGSYRLVASPIESLTDVKQDGATLRLSTHVGGVKLTSISGYVTMDDHWRQDFSGGVSSALLGNPNGGTVALFDRDSVTDHRQFSQEFQAAGDLMGGQLSYVAGLYGFNEKGTQKLHSVIFFAPADVVFNADTKSVAVFGQLSAKFGERTTVMLGGRYTKDDKHLDGKFGTAPFDQSSSYSRFNPKLGVDFKLTPDVLLYASYSEGFKAGGYNGLAGSVAQISKPFLPQYTDAFDLGVKSELLDRKLRINAALFHNKIRNRQQTLTVSTGPSAGAFVVESYNAKLSGLELEFVWKAMPGLQLWANGAINTGKYTSCSTTIAVSCSVINNKLPIFPDHVYTVGADAEHAVGSGTLRYGADYSERDPYFSTADNVLIGWVKRQQLLNAYVAYEQGAWTYQLAGKNLLQQEGWQTGFGFAVVQPRFAIPARTVLLTAKYKF